ncbi:MAG: HAD family hydrolase [Bdellovibrionales bacterium]
MNQYKALIFDLDDTLFDTYGQLIQVALKETCQKMINCGLDAKLDQAMDYRNSLFDSKPRCNFCEELVSHFGVSSNSSHSPDQVIELGNQAFYSRKVGEDISVFSGVFKMLDGLQHSFKLYLVTAGNLETQQQKIHRLRIAEYFISIYCMDPSLEQTKSQAFKKILTTLDCKPADILSIGNRLDNEIKEAKELGMDTCYFVHGEYAKMKPSCPEENPDYTIDEITELVHILEMPEDMVNELKNA